LIVLAERDNEKDLMPVGEFADATTSTGKCAAYKNSAVAAAKYYTEEEMAAVKAEELDKVRATHATMIEKLDKVQAIMVRYGDQVKVLNEILNTSEARCKELEAEKALREQCNTCSKRSGKRKNKYTSQQ